MQAEGLQVGFCENGAGYGGAVISLVAFLEKIPAEFRARIYTSLGTENYQQLSRLGPWQHMRQEPGIGLPALKSLRAPFASTLDNLCNLLPYAMRYYRAFRADGIELVYLNNDANCNMPAALAAKFAGLPMVLHARGFHTDTRGTRWVLKNIDHCIAVSTAVKAGLMQLGLPDEKCTVVPEGLDLALFHPRAPLASLRGELGLAAGQPVITLVGGLIDWKGQDVLLDAIPAIVGQFPDAQFLLVGSAYGKDDTFARMIADRAASPALRPHVQMLGSRQDIPDILALSTIVLHASTQPEPFGRTFLEGMALGRPVIASNEGGPLDVIEHEADGLLIEPRNPERLAQAVNRLLHDAPMRDAMGARAARKALDYSIENHTSAISAVLRNTMSRRSR